MDKDEQAPAALAQKPLQPHPLTSVMQMLLTASSMIIAAAAIAFAIRNFTDDRNARLVEIGVSILRVDPAKEAQVGAARSWALDLIDANSGGVKFSKEAREQLLGKPLRLNAPGPRYESSLIRELAQDPVPPDQENK